MIIGKIVGEHVHENGRGLSINLHTVLDTDSGDMISDFAIGNLTINNGVDFNLLSTGTPEVQLGDWVMVNLDGRELNLAIAYPERVEEQPK